MHYYMTKKRRKKQKSKIEERNKQVEKINNNSINKNTNLGAIFYRSLADAKLDIKIQKIYFDCSVRMHNFQ
jgi:hypothetical protein